MNEYSLAAICPAADRDILDVVAVVFGVGAETWVAQYSADGSAPATHYGYSCYASAERAEIMQDPALREPIIVATDWTALGVAEVDVRAALARHLDGAGEPQMRLAPGTTSPSEVMSALLTAHGLQPVQPE